MVNHRKTLKNLLFGAIVIQFIILLFGAYIVYLIVLYPNYSDEFGFGRRISLMDGRYESYLTTSRTTSRLIIHSDAPVNVYLDGKLVNSGDRITINLQPYQHLELIIEGEIGTVVYVKLENDIPIIDLIISIIILLVMLPVYIKRVNRLRSGI